MKKRRNNIFKRATQLGADAVLITALPSLRYITGFSGSSGISILTEHTDYFITDFRYREQVKAEVEGYEFGITQKKPIRYAIEEGLIGRNAGIAFEDERISYLDYNSLLEFLPPKNLIPLGTVIGDLQQVKDAGEIEKIKRAAEITDTVFRQVCPMIVPGISELDIAAEISYQIRRNGGEKEGFESIVASGPRSAMPHARTSSRMVQENEFVILDFGAVFEGYHADLTRTVLCGEPDRKKKEIYTTVLEAQRSAINSAKHGISAAGLDAVARNVIAERGFGEFFGHGLGHGLGLEIHEAPRLAPSFKSRLKSGNVVTIEPGIYVPGLGGVRIEDDVLITKNGCEVLTHSPKNLKIQAS